MSEWLPSLQTETAQEGFELALTLARKGVGYTQPSAEGREKLRDGYANTADSLTFSSQGVATQYHTVAVANNYWKSHTLGVDNPHLANSLVDVGCYIFCYIEASSVIDRLRASSRLSIQFKKGENK